MPFLFSRGDIYQASFPFEENEAQTKERAVFVWSVHANAQAVLVSKITGTIGRSQWELQLQPTSTNGLTKPSVLRVDQMRYIPIEAFLFPRGTLSAFEIAAASELLKKYLAQD